MKIEHAKILKELTTYLEENPSIRFGQALYNLNINEFASIADPESEKFQLRDIHSDSDKQILERMKM